jgi:hypothetical protein
VGIRLCQDWSAAAPDPWESDFAKTGPLLPPDPWESDFAKTGPLLPPDPWESDFAKTGPLRSVGIRSTNAAVAHVNGAVAVIRRGLGVVRDHEDGLAQPLVQVAQNLEHGFGVLGVEVAGGLVGQQNGRVVDDGARDGHALLLAAGERVGLVIQPAGDAEQAQHLVELGIRLRPGPRCSAPPRCCRAR